jgi:hypothetical protein
MSGFNGRLESYTIDRLDQLFRHFQSLVSYRFMINLAYEVNDTALVKPFHRGICLNIELLHKLRVLIRIHLDQS